MRRAGLKPHLNMLAHKLEGGIPFSMVKVTLKWVLKFWPHLWVLCLRGTARAGRMANGNQVISKWLKGASDRIFESCVHVETHEVVATWEPDPGHHPVNQAPCCCLPLLGCGPDVLLISWNWRISENRLSYLMKTVWFPIKSNLILSLGWRHKMCLRMWRFFGISLDES